jgi:hypothetical protein
VYRQRRTGKVFKGFSFEPNPRNPGWRFQLPTARWLPNEARSQAMRRPPLTCERAASFPSWAAEPAEALPCLGPLVSAVPAPASAERLDRSTSQVTCSRSWDFPPASVSGSQGQRKRASERCVQRSLALASCDARRRDKRRPLANDGSTPRLSLHRRDEVAASPARLGGRWSERCALASYWPTVRWIAKQNHHAPMRRT